MTDSTGYRASVAAQVQDCLLGGETSSETIRAAAKTLDSVEGYHQALLDAREFTTRAIVHAARAGISQFAGLGCGLPLPREDGTPGPHLNLHQAARRVDPGARVAYVDREPPDTAHARGLLAAGNRITVAGADFTQPLDVARELAGGIDFTRPVCLLLPGVLHFVHAKTANTAIGLWKDQLAAGSWLVISHAASNLATPELNAVEEAYASVGMPFRPRSAGTVRSWFTRCVMTDPATGRPGVGDVAWWGVTNPHGPGRVLMLGGAGVLR